MKKILILIPILWVFNSCSRSTISHSQPINQTVNFIGTWTGSYSGSDNGAWIIFIDANGIANGRAHSIVYNEDVDVSGTVDASGNLNAVLGSTSNGGYFKGKLTGTTGKGTWQNNLGTPHSGIWTGAKQ